MRRVGHMHREVLVAVLVLTLGLAACRTPSALRQNGPNAANGLVSVPPATVPTPTPTSPAAPAVASVSTALPTGVGGSTRDIRWDEAIRLADGSSLGVVTVPILNVRSAPLLSAPVLGNVFGHHPIPVFEQVRGDTVDGNPYWYRVAPNGYASAALVDPLIPPTPPKTYTGHWVDVNLTQFYAIAYDGSRPVYAAIITAGRDGATPTGVFQVFARLRNETMDSATVGIPKGSPHYYHLTNVQYTQYFEAGGYALHQNYWTPPDQFGNYSTNGCVGLLLPDAAWFWDFLSDGSTVSVHA
ncbi:MAG TPA: L,D-transpeptidase family protein [Thermomicrobiaceae bacterium]|nr:L,D-transpeptidase family protein [Thermomicrobiaceae bacterium]